MNHLHLSSFATERDLRLAIIEAGRICYNSGLMHANTGNISVRLGNDRLVITPSKVCIGRLEPEDLLIIDLDGAIVKADSTRKRKFSSEAPLHLSVYRQRADIRAVIHAHPSNATALTVAGIPFPVDILPEVLEALGPVPTTRFALPDSTDDAAAISEYVKEHNAILMRNHGAITFGVDLEEALNYLEQLESVAKTVVTAHLLGKVNHLPDEIMSAMRETHLKKTRS
jgi:L-fuculose-phosphate aldolase